jgi:hypothetical protein
MSENLRVLVDDDAPKIKGALPLPGLESLSQRVVELSGDALRASINGALQNVLSVISDVTQESESHVVSQVSFSLMFDASGEVSLVSLAKGSVKGSSGLQFTITRK